MVEKIEYKEFKKEVIYFLKQYDILKAFEENLINLKHKTLNQYIYYYYRNTKYISFFIVDAFLWEESDEGYSFWKNINNKYYCFCTNIEQKFWYD